MHTAPPYWCWSHLVNAYLRGYCGRVLADLPDGVGLWLLWAYRRGWPAQSAADFLSMVKWRQVA